MLSCLLETFLERTQVAQVEDIPGFRSQLYPWNSRNLCQAVWLYATCGNLKLAGKGSLSSTETRLKRSKESKARISKYLKESIGICEAEAQKQYRLHHFGSPAPLLQAPLCWRFPPLPFHKTSICNFTRNSIELCFIPSLPSFPLAFSFRGFDANADTAWQSVREPRCWKGKLWKTVRTFDFSLPSPRGKTTSMRHNTLLTPESPSSALSCPSMAPMTSDIST